MFSLSRHIAKHTRSFSSSRHFSGAAAANVKIAEKVNTQAAPIKEDKIKATNSEGFVEALAAQKVKDVFGIVGSAFMDALDMFPAAGIRFVSVQHEQNSAHMADGYARVSGKHGVVIGQNGPGVTNSVTGIAAAYYSHSPVVMITPECSSTTKGMGGFQESDNMKIFEAVVKSQHHVHHPSRIVEQTNRAFDLAMSECGPSQLNIPRDYFYGEGEFKIRGPKVVERSAGGPASLDAAFDALKSAKNPVLVCGGGVVISPGGVEAAAQLASYLGIPAASTYLHNDSFPASHPSWTGPIGYCGAKASMNCLKNADLVLAVGSRLNPFGTLPQYGMNYWPEDATLVQVEIDPKRLGLTKQADIEVCGDASLFLQEMLDRAKNDSPACLKDKDARMKNVAAIKADWEHELDAMTSDQDAVHKSGNGLMKPREVLRELEKNMPAGAIVSTDIGNICSVANSYLRFEHGGQFLAPMTFGNCGYASPAVMGAKVAKPDAICVSYSGEGAWGMQLMETLTCVRENIPITAVVFNNGQWGAEKKNQVLWFGDRYVGTNLENPSFAEIAKSMGAEGIKVTEVADVGKALNTAVENQRNGKTTILEMMCTRELGEPFRRDAMKLPKRMLAKYQHTTEVSESSTGQPVDPRSL